MKKIIVSGGGTGGHIFPALSIANALKRADKDIDILFVGAEGKMEMEKVPEAGYPIIGLPVRGFQRKLTFQNIKVLINLWRSLRKAKKVFRDFCPDVVVGVGGYASGPIGRVAAKKGIPVVLQEQNSYAGVTNRLLGKKAAKICVAYDGMDRFFPADKIVYTGNPVRKTLLESAGEKEEALKMYGLDSHCKTILVTGGSLGARTLNEMIKQNLDVIAAREDIQVLWQCGSYYNDALHAELDGKLPKNVHLTAFLKRMDMAYSCADLVVARAGAGTISELCLLKKPTVLIPSPNVSEDHQTKNAMALVHKEAAVLMKDTDAVNQFVSVVIGLVNDKERLCSLSENIAKLAAPNADDDIAAEILKLIK